MGAADNAPTPAHSGAPAGGGDGRARDALGWAAVALLLLVQYGLFYQFARREVVWAYPGHHDQIAYLSDSYETYEEILDKGLLPGLRCGYRKHNPQGVLLPLEAALLFFALGPSRLAALTLTFLHFALLQLVLVWVLRWLTRRWSAALLGLGLLLTALAPFYWAGGLTDFRLDFGALCLFGVLLGLALRANVFASRRWSALVGLAAAWLVLFRTITLVYLVGAVAVLVPLLAARLWRRRRDPTGRRVELRRWAGLALATLVVAAVCAPVLWGLRANLKEYYVQGHVTGQEPLVRLRMFFAANYGDYRTFYPRSLLLDHAGPVFLRLALVALAACGLVALCRRGAAAGRVRRPGAAFYLTAALLVPLAVYAVVSARPVPDGRLRAWDEFAFLRWGAGAALAVALAGALRRARATAPEAPARLDAGPALVLTAAALLVPLAALTINVQRSPVVGGIALPALLWAVLVAVVGLTGAHRNGAGRAAADRWLAALAAVALLAAGWTQLTHYARRTQATRARADVERLVELYDLIARQCADNDWKRPVISSTGEIDYLNHGVARIHMYERGGAFRQTSLAMESLFATTAEEVRRLVGRSDFVLVRPVRHPSCPFEDSMVALWPQVLAACEADLHCLRKFHIFGDEVALYVRPCLKAQGYDDGWVTADGLTLTGPAWALAGRKRLELRGKSPFHLLPKEPAVTARLSAPGQAPRELKATLWHRGEDYCLMVDLDGVPAAGDAPVQLRLTFDTYFEPRYHPGWESDLRRLVLRKPESTALVR